MYAPGRVLELTQESHQGETIPPLNSDSHGLSIVWPPTFAEMTGMGALIDGELRCEIRIAFHLQKQPTPMRIL